MKLVNLTTAKALQELGYDGEYTYCHVGVYPKNEYQIMTPTECEKYRHDIIILCAAPRLDDVAYWLRDKFLIYICVMPEMVNKGNIMFYAEIQYWSKHRVLLHKDITNLYDDYDTALEAAVTKAIEIIKTRSND